MKLKDLPFKNTRKKCVSYYKYICPIFPPE